MRIGFIGAGKVGLCFGIYFKQHNKDVVGYFSKSKNDLLDFKDLISSECFDNLEDLLKVSDTLFLTVNDDSIKTISAQLLSLGCKGKILIHTSGCKSSDIFGDLKNDNDCYSLHPILNFNDVLETSKMMSQCSFTLEGSLNKLEEVKEFITGLGNKVTIIETSQKPTYHGCCVLMSNLVNALIYTSHENLKRIGFNDLSIFSTLIQNNINSILKLGPDKSISGPISRDDITTVQSHLNSFSGLDKEIYIALSKKICEFENVNSDDILELLKETK